MPLYEYICQKCEAKFESFKHIGDRASSPCPECSNEAILVPSVFDFKFYNPFTKDGQGFTTEYAKKGKLKELQRDNQLK